MKISTIVNNYNYAPYLAAAIDSALAQDYPDHQVVVVDDGSTDGSRDVIKKYGNRIVPVLKENGGQASSFNAGVAAATGDVICFLDADDEFGQGKIARVSELLAGRTTESILLYHLLQMVDRSGSPTGGTFPSAVFEVPKNLYGYAARHRHIPYIAAPTTGLAITRALAEELFPLPHLGVATSADEVLVKAAALLASVEGIPDVLGIYRIHGGNSWFGKRKPLPAAYYAGQDAFLNGKLGKKGLPPVMSFFTSVYAREFYEHHQAPWQIVRLALDVLKRGRSSRELKFFMRSCLISARIFTRFYNRERCS